MKKPKMLILIRHADRNKKRLQDDNGLSTLGRRQAKSLLRFFQKEYRRVHPTIYSSPAVRCLETVGLIAQNCHAKIKSLPDLGEQREDESKAQFARRVGRFCKKWKTRSRGGSRTTPTLTIVCSHGDWIPVAMQVLIGLKVQLRKGAWSEIILKGSTPELHQVIQSFPTVKHAHRDH